MPIIKAQPTQKTNNLSDIIKATIDLRAHIESVTGQHFKKEAAGWHLPQCPFCGSHSGFHISAKTPHLWKCFNCSEKQDSLIGFEKRRLNCDVKEAIKSLANHYGITTSTEKRVGEKIGASLPYPPESTNATPNPNRVLAKTIWQNATPLPLENAVKILQKRSFCKYTKGTAKILAQIVRINTWKGTKKLVLPQIENGEIVGLHMICQDLHTKNDLGEKAGALLLSGGKNKDTCIIVESLFNALAISALGYSALIMFGCENKKAIANWLPTARQNCNKVILWLDRGQEERSQKYAGEFGLDAVVAFAPEKEKNYAIKDMLAESDTAFLSNVEQYIAEAYARSHQVNGLGAMENYTLDDLAKRLENPVDKSILMVLGGTGAGKTTLCLKVCAMLAKADLPSLFFCSTVQEAQEKLKVVKGILGNCGLSPDDADLVVSGSESGKEDDAQDDSEENIAAIKACKAKIIITTYGYLGRKGETATGYKIGHEMIEGRYVFCDEVQVLYEKMKVFYQLLARYLLHMLKKKNQGQYDRVVQCPKASHKGDCSKCIIAALQYEDKKNHVREFYYKFAEQALSAYATKEDLGILSWDDVLDTSKYSQVFGTLFMQYLTFNANFNIAENTDATSNSEFLFHLSQTIINPHLRIHLPIDKETQAPVSPDAIGQMQEADIKKLQLPCLACGIPSLCGVDVLALLQLMGGKLSYTNKAGIRKTKEYKGARAVVMTSATIPAGFIEAVQKVAAVKSWQIEKKELTVVPFRFDVTLLKTTAKLGAVRTTKILTELDKRTDKKCFVVTCKKSDSDDLVTCLRKSIPEKVVYFYKDAYDYEHYKQVIENALHKILLTYPRSAITRAANFPDFDCMMVDCSMFLPSAAIGEIRPGMTADELKRALFDDIHLQLTQIIGRILRTRLSRIEGQTVDDPRKIVVLLHGLPDGLEDFALDAKLTHTSRDYRETFMSKNPKKTEQSLVDSIAACLDGKEPVDYDQIEKEELAEKPKEDMTLRERVLLNTPDAKAKYDQKRGEMRQEKTLERLIAQGLELKNKGKNWREIYKALNLNRHEDLVDAIKRELDF